MSSLYLMGITATTAALEIIVGILYLLLNEQFFVVGFFFLINARFYTEKIRLTIGITNICLHTLR